jgi:TPR repeat protein
MSELLNREIRASHLYQLAEKHWTDGELRRAFRLFLAAAKTGLVPAFDRVAQFYDNGWGVKTNFDAALYWYEQAYRNGHSEHRRALRLGLTTIANNIGCILRDRGERKKSIGYFQRAAKLGDGDANLNIAKVYLLNEDRRHFAIRYLQKTISAPYVTDGSIEEAKALLKEIRPDFTPPKKKVLKEKGRPLGRVARR